MWWYSRTWWFHCSWVDLNLSKLLKLPWKLAKASYWLLKKQPPKTNLLWKICTQWAVLPKFYKCSNCQMAPSKSSLRELNEPMLLMLKTVWNTSCVRPRLKQSLPAKCQRSKLCVVRWCLSLINTSNSIKRFLKKSLRLCKALMMLVAWPTPSAHIYQSSWIRSKGF